MSVAVQIPTALRRFTGERSEVPVEGATVGEALADLVRRHPEIGPHLFAEDGSLRAFVHVFRGASNVRDLEGEDTPVVAGEPLVLVPAIAGGVPDESDGPPRLRDLLAERSRPQLDPAERRRYSRHLILPEVGPEGQRRLKASRVLVVGAGGLGSPLALYLAAAGVGTLGLVDFDVVDESNLHRQVLYGASDVGRKKLDAARERLAEVNPHVEVVGHESRLTSDNALEILERYDVVVDGTDNFPTRYLVNDACVLLDKPNVYGSIFRFEGQVGVFWGAHGPCYRCLFAEPPPPGLVPSCAEGGVLGVLPGVIGALQANEAIKLVLGRGEPAVGRLILYDAWKLSFRELRLKKNPECPVCSERPTQTGLIDYEDFCGLRAGGEGEEQEPEAAAPSGDGAGADLPFEIDVRRLAQWLGEGRRLTLLDVRNPLEYELCRIEGSTLIPLPELTGRVEELDRAELVVAYCHTGVRSAEATSLLRRREFRAVNLAGGIEAWSRVIDPSVPRY